MLPLLRVACALALALLVGRHVARASDVVIFAGFGTAVSCTLVGDLCDWSDNFVAIWDFENVGTNRSGTSCGSSCDLTLSHGATYRTGSTCNPSGSTDCSPSGTYSLEIAGTDDAAWCDNSACSALMPAATDSWTFGCMVHVNADTSNNFWAMEGTTTGWGSQRGNSQDRFKARFGTNSVWRESDGSADDSDYSGGAVRWETHAARYAYGGSTHAVRVYHNGTVSGTASATGTFQPATNAADDFGIGASVNSGTAATDALLGYYDLCWLIKSNLSENSICRLCACGPANEFGCQATGATYDTVGSTATCTTYGENGRNVQCGCCLDSVSEAADLSSPGVQ